jgi:hypothetical protein
MRRDPDWLLDSKPREVQKEALRRSYGGFALRDRLQDPETYFPLHSGAARGWSHYLEMRLGKSALLLAEYELFQRDHGVKGLVIICPNSFKGGWLAEVKKSGTLVSCAVWDSSKPQLAEDVLKAANGAWILVINYEAVRTDKAKAFIEKWTKGIRWGLGLDESIKIKDHSSIQTKSALALAKEAYFVRNLSGKPMTQGPQDMYPQFRAIGEQNGVNYYAFRGRFCKMGGYKAKKIVGAKNEDQLQELIRRTSFVAKKRDWGLPGKSEYSLEKVEVTPQQAKHYKEMDDDFVTYLDSGVEVTADVVISKMMKLLQISSGFVYVEGAAHFFEDPKKLPKMQRLLDNMEEANGKVIVCYHYSASGDALLEVLKGYNPAVIRGQQWMKQNGLDVDSEKTKFNEDPNCRVAVCQISATKYGHTLIGAPGDRCETMAFYESTYSLDDRSQVEMRNTYFDQEWTNLYLDYVGTEVEAGVAKALQMKDNIVEAIIDAYRNAST